MTEHINTWLQGMFKSVSDFNENAIKRWLSQKCIGYQARGEQLISVFKAQVEMDDGKVEDIWYLTRYMSIVKTIVREQHRIDIENK